MKIHFASFYGVAYDLDLFKPWALYYQSMHFDSYKVFLHDENNPVSDSIRNRFLGADFKAEVVSGKYSDGRLQDLVLGRYAQSLQPSDLLVIADADEFHNMPGLVTFNDYEKGSDKFLVPNFRELAESYDMLTGFLTDRYSMKLEPCTFDPLIEYPFEEPFTGEYIKDFTPPWLRRTKWPKIRRTKILMAPCGYLRDYSGSHYLEETPGDARIMENFKVLHFAWRESARVKTALKSYYRKENADEVLEYPGAE